MNLRKYEKYKESDVEWLGKMPDHWVKNQVKRFCKNITDGAHTSPDLSSNDFPFLSVVDLKNGKLDFNNCLRTSKKDFEQLVKNGCKPKKNSVLFSKDGTIGETVVIKENQEFVVASSFLILSPILRLLRPEYLHYYLSSNFIKNQSRVYAKGAGLPRISIFNFSKLIFLLPPIQEQTAIATYLDQKTAAIDNKVHLLVQKIDKYKDLKKALINETICRGLDKNVKLKESGIEWLGNIPEHWEVKRGKEIFTEKSIKGHELEPLLAASQKYGVVLKSMLDQRSMEAQKDFQNFKFVKKGDFVISLRSFEGGIEMAHFQGIISPAYSVFSGKKEVEKEYFKHIFKASGFIQYLGRMITGIRDGQTIRYDEINKMLFVVPPLREQINISEYLDGKINKIDIIAANLEKQIETLKELRKTIINDIVTGKIRVTEPS